MSFDLRPRRRAGPVGPAFAQFATREEIPFARKGICFLQHDFDVANGSGATVRADFNNAIEALATLSSGATEPGTTYQYQLWADTTAGLLKQRNAANGAWEVRGTLAETLKVARSSDTILAAADHGKFFVATAGFTQTLTAAATLGDGWYLYYRVNSGATVVFDPNSTENIDGATTKSVVGPAAGVIFCDGSNFFTYGFDNPGGTTSVAGIWEAATQAEVDAGTASRVLTSDLNRISLGTPVATTSGTSVSVASGLPTGLRRIQIPINGLSLSGTAHLLVQIGDSGGLETTSYDSSSVIHSGSGSHTANAASTAGFIVQIGSAAALLYGVMTLTLQDASTNRWLMSFTGHFDTGNNVTASGTKALSATLDRVSLTTTNGTDTFDAGSANYNHER